MRKFRPSLLVILLLVFVSLGAGSNVIPRLTSHFPKSADPLPTTSTTANAEPALGDYEPHLTDAKAIGEEIRAREEKLAQEHTEVLTTLEAAVKEFDAKQPDTMDNVVEKMRPAVQHLYATSQEILSKQAAYFADLKLLHDSITKAPAAYRAASAVFTQYADSESFSEIKDDYRMLADSWRLMADAMESRQKDVAVEGKEIVAFRTHLEHTALYLQRLDQHLATVPEMLSSEQRALHLEQLRRYIDGFETLRKTLRAFHDKLQPAVNAAQPAVNVAQPAVNAAQPAVNVPQPAVNVPQPAVNVPQPAVNAAQPAVNAAQPVPTVAPNVSVQLTTVQQ